MEISAPGPQRYIQLLQLENLFTNHMKELAYDELYY